MSELLDLPDHLINEILLRLPVRSIGRCKCVSKPWRSFLSSRQFARTHFNFHLNDPETFIFKTTGESLYNLTLTSTTSGNDTSDGDAREVSLPFGEKLFRLLSSCHGLVLFQKWNGAEYLMFLMNLITLEAVEVEVSDWPYLGPCIYELGYDAASDDYKIVRLSRYSGCAVYSVGMKTWRRIEDSPYVASDTPPFHTSSGVLVNGSLHWTFGKDSGYVISAFDWASNKFVEVPSPIGVKIDEIRVLEGCLAFVSETESTIDVWVMKEYGVIDSWTKHSIIDPLKEVDDHVAYEVICVLNEDEFVLLRNGDRLVAYNWRNGVYRDMAIAGVVEGCVVDGFGKIMVVRESLLPPSESCLPITHHQISLSPNYSSSSD